MKRLTNLCESKPWIFLSCLAAWLYIEYYILGPFSYYQIHENGDTHHQRYIYLAKEILNGQFFDWYAPAAGGVVLAANGVRIFDLITLLNIIFPFWLAPNLIVLFKFAIASIFTKKLLEEFFKVDSVIAILAAGICGYLQSHHLDFGLGFASIPMLFYAITQYHEYPLKKILLPTLGLGLSYSIIAPFHNTLIYSIPLVFAWIVFVIRPKSLQIYATTTVFFMMAILPQVPLLFSMHENSGISHRVTRNIWAYIPGFWEQLWGWTKTFTVQYFLLLLPCLVTFRKLKFRSIFYLAIFIGLIGFSSPYLLTYILEPIGFPKGFNLDRISRNNVNIVPILFALGMQALVKRYSISLHKIVFVTLSILVVQNSFVKAGHAKRWLTDGNYVRSYDSPGLHWIKLRFKESSQPFRVATLGGVIAGSPNGMGIETVDGYLSMYPLNYQKKWTEVIKPFLARHPRKKIQLENWGNKLMLQIDPAASHKGIDISKYFNHRELAKLNTRYIASFLPLVHSDLDLVHETHMNQPWDRMSKFEKGKAFVRYNFMGVPLKIYEIRGWRPRAFLVDKEAGHLEMKHYSNDSIIIKTQVNRKTELAVINNFHPGWKVWIDEKPASLLKLENAFWKVELPRGDHLVRFEF